jgi:AP-2 complex subunit mu-1
MISAIFIVNQKGDVIISRNYRVDELNRGIIQSFRFNVIASKDSRSPIKIINNVSFMHIRCENIFLVAISKYNVNVCLVFETLHRIEEIFRAYFGGKLDEETIKNNFILAYELLEEIIDYGYPQNTSLESIKPFITQKGALKIEKLKSDKLSKVTMQVTGACSWRPPDIKHKKNEIYIDVVESVNLLVSVDGKRLRADVSGQILLKVHLSGMPECKFGLNDKLLMDKEAKTGVIRSKTQGIAIDDCTFHQCVRLGKFDTDRTISFIPPEGEFELMKYRTTQNIEIPFQITPIIKEHSKTRLEVKVAVKSNFKRDMFGMNVKIIIPTPKNTAVCKIYTQSGRAKYRPESDAIVWKIRRFPGDSKFILGAEIELSATVSQQKKAWSRPPISMEFQVPMFTASGLHVRFLKVLEPKQQYQAIKWVRYLTQAGSYQYRI